MARRKQVSKRKRSKTSLPVWGAAGMSLALAGSASAAGVAPDGKTTAKHLIPAVTLGEEELSDVTLSKFFVFDRESTATRLGEKIAQRCGRCGGGCRGCAAARCARCGGGCAVARCGVARCGGCAVVRRCGVGWGVGCATCSCSCCLSWGSCQLC